MTLDDFKQMVEPKIVERGLDYYKDGYVSRLEKVGENEFSALVFGTRKYNVFVKLDGRTIAEYEVRLPLRLWRHLQTRGCRFLQTPRK